MNSGGLFIYFEGGERLVTGFPGVVRGFFIVVTGFFFVVTGFCCVVTGLKLCLSSSWFKGEYLRVVMTELTTVMTGFLFCLTGLLFFEFNNVNCAFKY